MGKGIWSKSKTGNVFYSGQKMPSSYWNLYGKKGLPPPDKPPPKTSSRSETPATPTTPTAPATPVASPRPTPASNKWSDIVSAYFPTQMKSGGLVRGNGCAQRGQTKGKMR
jgi:hypothetical protein